MKLLPFIFTLLLCNCSYKSDKREIAISTESPDAKKISIKDGSFTETATIVVVEIQGRKFVVVKTSGGVGVCPFSETSVLVEPK